MFATLALAAILGPLDDPTTCPHDHALELLEARVDVPPGFPQADEFGDISSACEAMVPRLVEREDLRATILDWCIYRGWASSRHGRVVSRIDGSWVHDRDRPVARSMYRRGLASGALDPDTCEHHRVDVELKRDREARSIVDRWPYATYCDYSGERCTPSTPGTMLASVADRWMSRPPDFERFGTRGPIDINAGLAAKHLGGCWPPEQLDRYDVAAAVTIERSEALCERLESTLGTRAKRNAARNAGLPTTCSRRRDLRQIWAPRFWFDRLRLVLSRTPSGQM